MLFKERTREAEREWGRKERDVWREREGRDTEIAVETH